MPKVLRAVEMDQCIACIGCMLTCARERYGSFSVERSAIRVRTTGGFQSQMIADICMGCNPPPCAEVCMSGALTPRKGGGVRFDRSACFACKKCMDACPVRVITFDEALHIPIICIQCGACARHCPHDCLEMVSVEDARENEDNRNPETQKEDTPNAQ